MSFSTLLDIVQVAFGELGLDEPTSVASPDGDAAAQMFRIANAAGRDLMRAHDWSALQKQAIITTVAGQGDYDLPADFSRLIDDTEWDATNHWSMVGPDTPQSDEWRRQSGLAQVGTRRVFRLVAGIMRIFPTPPKAGETLVYEYVSNAWAMDNDDVAQSSFLADTDTCIFDPDLMVKEMKWRWMAAKGMEATMLKGQADIAQDLLIASDLGGPTLNMGPTRVATDGEVVAGTSPNFRLSDGSGNDLAVE